MENEARSKEIGVTHRMRCPWCMERKGTTDIAENLIFVRELGTLKYYCHSASCGAKGILADDGSLGKSGVGRKFSPKRHTKPLLSIKGPALKFVQRYGITEQEYSSNGWKLSPSDNYLYVPILNHMSYHIADYLKNLGEVNRDRPKNLIYKHSDVPLLHWPITKPSITDSGHVLVVEDPISSIITGRTIPTVSILGTSMRLEQMFFLKGLQIKGVLLMLDPDATGKAFKIKNQYQHILPIKVVVSPKGYDPKDLVQADIKQLVLTALK